MTLFAMRIAITALIVGACLFSFGASHKKREQNGVTTNAVASDVFEGTGYIDDLKEEFLRSTDGVTVRYGCTERYSSEIALTLVCGEKLDARLVEKTTVFDHLGSKVGERVVWDGGYNAWIDWSDGPRVFSIQALNVTEALSFEKSKVWASSSCWDMRAFDERHHRTNRWTRAAIACLSSCPCK
jgi:hypothetical protein